MTCLALVDRGEVGQIRELDEPEVLYKKEMSKIRGIVALGKRSVRG